MISKFSFFVQPDGLFRKVLGSIILIVGLLVITGYIKQVETYVVEKNIFVNTLKIDTFINDILLKNHNNTNALCTNGKCDE